MTKKMKILATGAAIPTLLALGLQVAGATAISANYKLAPNSTGDEEIVGPFDTYDLANGVALLEAFTGTLAAPVVGNVINVFFQSHLQAHQLGAITVANPALNLGKYEITLVADFQEQIASVSAFGVNSFVLPGGTARLYLDTTPDKNYLTDFGFTNEDVLITGTILGGLGTLTAQGVGFESITVQVTGFNAAVYSPLTLIGANGIFTLDINSTSIQNVNSVQGHTFNPGTDMLIGADGNIKISAVPVPAAVWMLGSALVGMTTIRRRPQG